MAFCLENTFLISLMWYTREQTLTKIEVSKDIHNCNIRF